VAQRRYAQRDSASSILPVAGAGPHRRPGLPVGTPALARHLGFWFPGGRQSAVEDLQALRDRWKYDIDLFLLHLIRIVRTVRSDNATPLDEDFSHNIAGGEVYLFAHKARLDRIDQVDARNLLALADESELFYETVSLNFEWQEITARIRAELRSEYFTLSVHLDFSKRGAGQAEGDADPADLSRNPMVDCFRALDGALTKRLQSLAQRGKRPSWDDAVADDADRDRLATAHNQLYLGVWSEFESAILAPAAAAAAETVAAAGKAEPADYALLGMRVAPFTIDLAKPFIDFRGVVLGSAPPAYSTFRLPFSERSSIFVEAPGAIGQQEAIRDLQLFWPFIRCGEPRSGQATPTLPPEYTASLFQDRRTIYCSSLGLPLRGHLSVSPVFYFIFTRIENRWQIGRIVDRIHTLGTVRIAALIGSRNLRELSEKLQGVGDKLANLQTDVNKINERKLLDPDAARIYNNPQLFRDLNTIQTRLSQISDSVGSGGLAYRVERSRYYVQQFRELVPALRIQRIEGFQPYDEFVIRRMSGIYDEIDRLGIRFERAYGRLNSLLAQINTMDAIERQEELIKTNVRLTAIQAFGETFLLVFLLPYYLGHVLFGALNLVGEGVMGLTDRLYREEAANAFCIQSSCLRDEAAQGICYVLALLVGLGVWLYRIRGEKKRATTERA